MKHPAEALPQTPSAVPPFPSRADLPMLIDPRPQLEEINKLFAQLPTAADPKAVWEEITRLSLKLPETDGIPMETNWHVHAMNQLLETLEYHFQNRNDFFVGGNMFLYYSTSRSMVRDFVGPDFFYVSGVNRTPPRERWIVWLENDRFPDVIVELISESTAREDRVSKRALYEQTFQTPEYYCYDSQTRRFDGWRLRDGRYQPIPPNERGWMWSEQLQLWLGAWEGTYRLRPDVYPRFYDSQGQLVPGWGEAEHQRAEAEKQKADAEHQRAEAEKQRAEAERQRAEAAETEKQKAEAELARLKALLARQSPPPDAPENPA